MNKSQQRKQHTDANLNAVQMSYLPLYGNLPQCSSVYTISCLLTIAQFYLQRISSSLLQHKSHLFDGDQFVSFAIARLVHHSELTFTEKCQLLVAFVLLTSPLLHLIQCTCAFCRGV